MRGIHIFLKRIYRYTINILNRFDAKIGGDLGFDFAMHFFIKAGYDYGILNVSAVEGPETHINYMFFSLGYKF